MEQIYVENKKKNKKPKFMNVTIGLSFAVAFVAILSIVLISMSGSSYSLSAVDFPDKITTTESNYFYVGFGTGVTEDDLEDPTTWKFFNPYMRGKDSANKNYDLLCLESAKDYNPNGIVYTNSKTMADDPGFVYLSAKLQNDSTLNAAPQAAKAWIKQQATWLYFGLIKPTDSTNDAAYTKSTSKNDLKAIKCIIGYGPETTTGGTIREPKTTVANCCKNNTTVAGTDCAYKSDGIFAAYGVDKWIETAISYHENGWPALSVTATKESTDFKLTNDKKYYTSSPIAVKISVDDTNGLTEALDDYTISISNNAPKGTKIMAWDEKSNKLVDVTNEKKLSYAKYKTLRVYVPSSADTGTYNFSLAVTGTIQQYTGYYYSPPANQNSLQQLTTVDVVNKTSTGEVEFSVQIVPDTATNLSKTIYIIGLIVLVSGLGILYVNVKKQKRFEQ